MQRKELLTFIKEERARQPDCYFFIQILQSFIDFTSNEILHFKDFKNYLEKNKLDSEFKTFNGITLCDFSQLDTLSKRKSHAAAYYEGDLTLSIHQVAHEGGMSFFELLVKNGADINIRNGHKISRIPLTTMILSRHLKVENIQRMIELGANVYFKDENNRTLLDHLLAKNIPNEHTLQAVNLLLKYGVTFQNKNYQAGNNPFRQGIKRLLDRAQQSSVEVKLTTSEKLTSIMTETLPHIPVSLINIMTSYTQDTYGYFFNTTPYKQLFLEDKLTPAAKDGNIDLIAKLITEGEDINIASYHAAWSAISLPVTYLILGKELTASRLQVMIDLGADIYFKDNHQNTLIDKILTKRKGNSTESIKLLLQQGVSFKSENCESLYPSQAQSLLKEAQSAELKSIPAEKTSYNKKLTAIITSTLRHVPFPLIEIIASYATYPSFGYFSKNKQLFLEEKEKLKNSSYCSIQ